MLRLNRVKGERGAVAIIVAILATALIGFAAIGVDVANMASDKQQLQNGADAVALAIAQDCSADTTNCTDNNPVLLETTLEGAPPKLAIENKNDGQARVDSVKFSGAVGNEVTVTVSDETEHWFAGIFEKNESTISARGTAGWGKMSGHAGLPLVLSLGYMECVASGGWNNVDDDESPFEDPDGDGIYTLRNPTDPPTTVQLVEAQFTQPTGNPKEGDLVGGCELDGNWIPGGFGWIDPDGTGCEAITAIGSEESSKPGAPPPQPDCKVIDLAEYVGKTLPVAVFENPPSGTGSPASYIIAGYVAFHITGYNMPGQWTEPQPTCDKCLEGYFDKFPAGEGSYTSGGPDWGSYVVRLILGPSS